MRANGWLAAALLGAALVLGGGGSPAPIPELILSLLASLAALAWLTLPGSRNDWQRVPKGAWWIAGLIVSLPLVQLVPLPPFVWQALPGREVQREALALIDLDQTWRPLALAPQRTLAALLSLLPPLLLLVMTAALPSAYRMRLVMVTLTVALAALLLGALQLTAGETSPVHLYDETRPVITGFQANRNSTADFLLVAMLAVPLLVRRLVARHMIPNRAAIVLGLASGGLALFALGVVLTASRSGMALLPIPLAVSLWLLRDWLAWTRRHLLLALAAVVASAVLGLVLVRSNPTLMAVAGRFDFTNELRPQLWRDAAFVARKYFPFGVGMGDFTPALIADEQLEAVRPFLPNRAHNDFLELLIEAGIAGIAVLGACSWIVLRAARRALRDPARNGAGLAWFAISGLAVFALHSMVDYPLRSMAMACLGAVCAGLLMAPRVAPDPGEVE